MFCNLAAVVLCSWAYALINTFSTVYERRLSSGYCVILNISSKETVTGHYNNTLWMMNAEDSVPEARCQFQEQEAFEAARMKLAQGHRYQRYLLTPRPPCRFVYNCHLGQPKFPTASKISELCAHTTPNDTKTRSETVGAGGLETAAALPRFLW